MDSHPSEVRLDIWAPDAGFNVAHNADLQLTGALDNMEYELEIDYVELSSPHPLLYRYPLRYGCSLQACRAWFS